MKNVKVYESRSGEYLGRGYLSDEDYARYEAQCESNPSGQVQLDEWMTPEEREHVTAQDDASVWFEEIVLASAE